MALTTDFNDGEMERYLQKVMQEIHEKIIAAMHMAGLKFITDAREQPGNHSLGFYEDKTSALRHSIDYFIFHNGELLEQSYSENVESNLQSVQEILESQGYQLIGIAGMNYASHVESKGYNVISNQADTCIVDLTRYFERIQKEIDKLNNL